LAKREYIRDAGSAASVVLRINAVPVVALTQHYIPVRVE